MRYRYIYKHKTGLTKVKTKLAVAFSGLTLAAGGTFASLAILGSAHAATGYTLFDSATQQSDGVHLISDSTHADSGISFNVPAGTTVGDLTDLEATFQVKQGDCMGGAPRFSIETATHNIFVYPGTLPSFTCTPGGPTGNLLSSGNRIDSTQFGGPFYGSWSDAVTAAGANTPVTGLALVVDAGWAGAQEFVFTSATVNTTSYSFLPATTFQVKPWTYDPGKTRSVSSAWVTHQGIKDAGGSDHALYLTKNTGTSTNAASGATVTYSGVLNSLGFDYRNDGHCGAGAPRFNVYTTSGTYYFFGCTYGTHTTSTENTNWTRVTFSNTDAFPADGVTAWPGFGNVTVTGIDVVFDEGTDIVGQGTPGQAYLDNIQVNGVYAGKPGLAQ